MLEFVIMVTSVYREDEKEFLTYLRNTPSFTLLKQEFPYVELNLLGQELARPNFKNRQSQYVLELRHLPVRSEKQLEKWGRLLTAFLCDEAIANSMSEWPFFYIVQSYQGGIPTHKEYPVDWALHNYLREQVSTAVLPPYMEDRDWHAKNVRFVFKFTRDRERDVRMAGCHAAGEMQLIDFYKNGIAVLLLGLLEERLHPSQLKYIKVGEKVKKKIKKKR